MNIKTNTADEPKLLFEFLDRFHSDYLQSFDDMLGVPFAIEQAEDQMQDSFSPPGNIISIIDFVGTIIGFFSVSMEEETIANILGLETLPSEAERKDFRVGYEDMLKEILNCASGCAVAILQKDFSPITILSPKIISGGVSYPVVPCANRCIQTEHGKITFSISIDHVELEINRTLQKLQGSVEG